MRLDKKMRIRPSAMHGREAVDQLLKLVQGVESANAVDTDLVVEEYRVDC